jgi:two-component system CheB/CheR fusion protein
VQRRKSAAAALFLVQIVNDAPQAMPPALTHPTLTIVGIGASAGGIEAFRLFFENMPSDSGMAFVVVLHLPADRKSILPELIGRWTAMPVVEVTDGCIVEPNCVYVPPSGIGILLREGHLHLHYPVLDEPREPSPISTFFDSLAIALGADAVGVVLSGTGSDGALGLKAIKARGGLTLAQGAEGSGPQHSGMPASAIAIGAVDIVAQVEDMPEHIIEVQVAKRRPREAAAISPRELDDFRRQICFVLQEQIGHDFSGYKDKTFLRRVQRRMDVLRIPRLEDYIERLKADRAEAMLLFRDLLIGVTSFFRDIETFEVLAKKTFPALFAGRGPDDVVRVWVPGCSTGEEAYSLAMLMLEYQDGLGDAAPKIQIFATDIDDAAITTARAGRYPSALVDEISSSRLARFFLRGHDGGFSVTKEVRELCTFSTHSLIRDPPFSRIDLVSCRNLLIYLDTDLQGGVIPAFHYSLVPGGILLLGSSETVSRHENLFATVDRSNRIFRRHDTPSPPLRLPGRPTTMDGAVMTGASTAPSGAPRSVAIRLNTRAGVRILERFGPAFVLVNAGGEITQYSSRTGRFLEPPSGLPSQSVFDLARRGLRAPLRALLKRAVDTGRPCEKANVSADVAGEGLQYITLAVEPLSDPDSETVYAIVFLEGIMPATGQKRTQRADGAIETIADAHFESELRDTREQLQSVTEEHETAVEELRSANEELHSVNEELQSANEELETSKEEIQSVNEELQTVNAQLASKVDELDHQNTDLQNLFASTQVATIFLDQHMVIRGFTPAVAGLYNLIPSDEGRPLTDIATRLRYGGLRTDVRAVLDTLEPLERRVVRDDGLAHYLMRILPYRAPDSTVDGAVITFVEVTSMVQAEQHQRLLVDELNHRVKNMLTVVISLATQTMRGAASMEEFSKNYLGRIHALTAAYSLLSNEAWQTVGLREVVLEELKPFAIGESVNFHIEGPVVALEPRAALALGMAIHELTTNAVKYGALSVPGGLVSVTWQLEQNADGRVLTMDWAESGGPPVSAPERRGFGMTLIERGLRQDMSADVEVDFAAAGVTARLRAPLLVGTTILPAIEPIE